MVGEEVHIATGKKRRQEGAAGVTTGAHRLGNGMIELRHAMVHGFTL